MTTNVYKWEGQIFHQQAGAPTGLCGSSPISRIVMDAIMDELKDIEVKSQIMHQRNPVLYETVIIHLLKKYVDDCIYAGQETKPGTMYDPQSKVLK